MLLLPGRTHHIAPRLLVLALLVAIPALHACSSAPKTGSGTAGGGHSLAGTWQATLPAASSPGRTMTLALNPDMTARMTTDYQNAQPSLVDVGTWQANGQGLAEVTLRREGQNSAPATMTFKGDAASLTAVDYDKSVWGSAGMTFMRTGGSMSPIVGGDRNPAGLAGSGWQWQSFQSPSENIKVSDPEKYTLEFGDDGNVNILAACNRGGGPVRLGDGTISINVMRLTRMACPPGSLDGRYTTLLTRVATWSLVNGELVMEIPAESSVLRFRRFK